MTKLLLIILLISPTSELLAGICEDKYPPIKTLVTKPIKVAYTAIVKVPVKLTKRCSEKRWKKIKKKPWKILTEPYTFWYNCTKTVIKDVKEKRYRDEFKEIEEIKESPEFLKCITKEKDLESAIKAFLLTSNPINGALTNIGIDNILINDKESKTSIKETNFKELSKTFSVLHNGRALTYKTLFKGTVSLDIFELVKSRETAIHKSINCSHRVIQDLKWTEPCLVDNRPIHQYDELGELSFICKKEFKNSQKFDRGLESGIKGDILEGHDNCKKIYSYIIDKFSKEKIKLNQIIKDQTEVISNVQFQSLSKELEELENE